MKKLVGNLFAIAVLCVSGAAFAGPNTDYELISGSGSVDFVVGDTIDIAVTFNNTGVIDCQGWSFGVCNDGAALDVIAVANGSTTLTVNGGALPGFNSINDDPMPGDGYTVGVVIDFFGVQKLAPGTDYELNVATYEVLAGAVNGGMYDLTFCDTLATPVVQTLIVEDGGVSAVPVMTGGMIEVGGVVVQTVRLLAEAGAEIQEGGNGTAAITADHEGGDVEGFSFGFTYDSAVVEATGASEGSSVAATNGGSGAGFFFANVAPVLPAGASGGAFVGCVISLAPPFDAIPSGVGLELAIIEFDAAGAAGDSTTVDFSDMVGDPVVAVVITSDGATVDPDELVSGDITITPGMPSLTEFVRGDGNDDGTVDVSDVVFIAKWAAGVGTAGTCDDAGDANDDGSLDIADPNFLIGYLFLGDPAPASPFGACGEDTTGGTAASCVSFNSCP